MTDSAAHFFTSDLDPHFKIFNELTSFRVKEILLVSSHYDAYILEEDVSLSTRIISTYRGLNLSRPPLITWAPNADQALELLDSRHFDLVITMPQLGDMDGFLLGARIKEKYSDIPVVMLSHSVSNTAPGIRIKGKQSVDTSYIWCCDSDILLAIIKSVEDSVNAGTDTEKGGVRVIILVEDSPLYRSNILPLLYNEVVKQTQLVLHEGLNEQYRLLKMRARPKILTASNYEEAMEIFNKYFQYVFGVLSDVRFPKNGKMADDAGFELLKIMRGQKPDLPLLMLSSDQANKELAVRIPAVFVEKKSKTLQEEIHSFLLTYLGFGDFIFRTPDGKEVGRAATLQDFEERIKDIPEESVRYHANNNHFSNWVMARAEIALAARLHKKNFTEFTSSTELREDILRKVHALRKLRQQGIVAQFNRDSYDPSITDFVKIGYGSMGGKARGLAFFASNLQKAASCGLILGEVNLCVPQTCVITTDGFDDFVFQNNLHLRGDEDDETIAQMFLAADMPDWLLKDLAGYLKKICYPLSVRSSSILEDAQFRPYAGLYNTFMLANSDSNFEARLNQLVKAVKLVYASAWFSNPRAFSRSIGQMREDSMAVIIQQLGGSCYGDFFYPAISGVAQSYNYYSISPMRPKDGIAHIAAGFGKTVVEGEQSLRFSPSFPENLPQFSTVDDILRNSQRWFYSLSYKGKFGFSRQQSNLIRREIDDARGEFPIRLLSSTYFPEEHRIRDADLPGHKILTFSPLLKYDIYPLSQVLSELLAYGREGMGCEIEIEFCLDLQKDMNKSTFYFLQIRPIIASGTIHGVKIEAGEREKALLRSSQALGHGIFLNMQDIIYVVPESFDIGRSRNISDEISKLNRTLDNKKTPYLLMGPGRWGTADPWLGIPVEWSDISGVGAIVELQGYGIQAEPSQGAHFFQNITSLGIPYLMIDDSNKKKTFDNSPEFVNWSYLNSLKAVKTTGHLRHVRLEKPLVLKVDSHDREAVLLLGH